MTQKLTLADLLPATAELQPSHPTLGELPFKLTLQGPQAAAVRKKGLETLAWLNTLERNKGPQDVASVMVKLEQLAGESAAAAVIGWDTAATEILGPFSVERAKELLTSDDFGWLREQVNQFVKDQQNFFRKPAAPADDAGAVEGGA
jgi:hypothetical protein